MGNFKTTQFLQMAMSVGQKLNREIRKLTDVMIQMDVINIYIVVHPNPKEYTFVSEPQGTFSNINHIVVHKENLNRYQKMK